MEDMYQGVSLYIDLGLCTKRSENGLDLFENYPLLRHDKLIRLTIRVNPIEHLIRDVAQLQEIYDAFDRALIQVHPLDTLSNLREMRLSGIRINDSALKYITEFAAHSTTLEAIDFGGCGISFGATGYICDMFRNMTSCFVVDLGSMELSQVQLVMIFAALNHNTKIGVLDLGKTLIASCHAINEFARLLFTNNTLEIMYVDNPNDVFRENVGVQEALRYNGMLSVIDDATPRHLRTASCNFPYRKLLKRNWKNQRNKQQTFTDLLMEATHETHKIQKK